MRIIFFGSSNYCLSLFTTLGKKFSLIAVVTKPNSFVYQFAKTQQSLKIFTPKNQKELKDLKEKIETLRPELAIVADYGLIIPKEIFTLPLHQTLNIHFSKLPDLRGPSPVQYALLRGDKTAWISVILMNEKIDTGDIIWQEEITTIDNQPLIMEKETSESLYQKLFHLAALKLPEIINKYAQKKLLPKKQNDQKATYTKILIRQDGFIPPFILQRAIDGDIPQKKELTAWPFRQKISPFAIREPLAILIERMLRAFSPWPGIWTEIKLRKNKQTERKRLKILTASLKTITPLPLRYSSSNTKVVKKEIKNFQLILEKVQLEGKKPVSWKQFQEGYPDFSFN